jgi:hypothetical protein
MFDWFITNSGAIVAVLFAVHALAVAIVNLTPTPNDDAMVAKAYRVIEMVAGIITPKAKQPGTSAPRGDP